MLTITSAVIRGIIAEALRARPQEACGYLAGTADMVTTWVPMRNTDASAEHFSMDPSEQFAAVRKLRAEGLKVLGVYHSHPATPARPSAEDIRLAYDPDISYVIVSLDGGVTTTKSFRIRAGRSEEEPITVV